MLILPKRIQNSKLKTQLIWKTTFIIFYFLLFNSLLGRRRIFINSKQEGKDWLSNLKRRPINFENKDRVNLESYFYIIHYFLLFYSLPFFTKGNNSIELKLETKTKMRKINIEWIHNHKNRNNKIRNLIWNSMRSFSNSKKGKWIKSVYT